MNSIFELVSLLVAIIVLYVQGRYSAKQERNSQPPPFHDTLFKKGVVNLFTVDDIIHDLRQLKLSQFRKQLKEDMKNYPQRATMVVTFIAAAKKQAENDPSK